MTLFRNMSLNIRRLQDAGLTQAALDVSLITADVLGIDRGMLGTGYEETLGFFDRIRIFFKVKRRSNHTPMAYILGYRDFYRDRFLVSRRSLIPRPDSEHLLYTLDDLKKQGFHADKILDLGTGTGALALSARHIFPYATMDALDIDIRLVKKNKKRMGAQQLGLIQADMLKWDNPGKAVYDVILANPPYLSELDMTRLDREVRDYEPARALLAGEDGMLFYRDIARRGHHWLSPGGYLLLEVDYKWEQTRRLFDESVWQIEDIVKDYSNLERVMVIKKRERGIQ